MFLSDPDPLLATSRLKAWFLKFACLFVGLEIRKTILTAIASASSAPDSGVVARPGANR